MESGFNKGVLIGALQRLPTQAALGFALCCAERMYPNYVRFELEHGWGNSLVIRNALDVAWAQLTSQDSKIDTRLLEQQCEAATPHTEDFDSDYVSPALDAASAAMMTLQLARTGEVGLAAEIASLARDTVDMFVQELEGLSPSDRDLESRILNHPFMQRELSRQREDLTLADSLGKDPEQLASALAHRWRNARPSSIDL
jgi:uncharacterized protein YjaG (DUF416 family)